MGLMMEKGPLILSPPRPNPESLSEGTSRAQPIVSNSKIGDVPTSRAKKHKVSGRPEGRIDSVLESIDKVFLASTSAKNRDEASTGQKDGNAAEIQVDGDVTRFEVSATVVTEDILVDQPLPVRQGTVRLPKVLNKISLCGTLLEAWNVKKRKELRNNILVKREALKEACKTVKPNSWRVIQNLEQQLDSVLSIEK
ncbi:hypothetical protein LWI28_022986 [Acer negundo]|uniref:Uncharacterized protein n=1 Tax=Acer negundo TaxID=4023 RepID=A0AAD5P2Q6_ACENE|nr:hypothetical protein LWI28_022986 [Acer negundo]